MKEALVAIFFGLCLAAKAQSFDATRPDAVYHLETVLDPASLLSPDNFSNIDSGRYVVVEGYIDYRATTWPEPDGDYHKLRQRLLHGARDAWTVGIDQTNTMNNQFESTYALLVLLSKYDHRPVALSIELVHKVDDHLILMRLMIRE